MPMAASTFAKRLYVDLLPYVEDSMIVDGRIKFAKSLEEWYRSTKIAQALARRGMLALPVLTDVAEDAQPALARVNPYDGQARWIADCPDCKVGAVYVWLEGPHLMICLNCGNRDIGYRWRRVVVPENRKAIEVHLLARPDPDTRGWEPGEALAALRADNASLGV